MMTVPTFYVTRILCSIPKMVIFGHCVGVEIVATAAVTNFPKLMRITVT